MTPDRLSAMVERWTGRNGRTDFRWSLWQGGKRVAMGDNAYPSAEAAEGAARVTARRQLGREPDEIEHL